METESTGHDYIKMTLRFHNVRYLNAVFLDNGGIIFIKGH